MRRVTGNGRTSDVEEQGRQTLRVEWNEKDQRDHRLCIPASEQEADHVHPIDKHHQTGDEEHGRIAAEHEESAGRGQRDDAGGDPELRGEQTPVEIRPFASFEEDREEKEEDHRNHEELDVHVLDDEVEGEDRQGGGHDAGPQGVGDLPRPHVGGRGHEQECGADDEPGDVQGFHVPVIIGKGKTFAHANGPGRKWSPCLKQALIVDETRFSAESGCPK